MYLKSSLLNSPCSFIPLRRGVRLSPLMYMNETRTTAIRAFLAANKFVVRTDVLEAEVLTDFIAKLHKLGLSFPQSLTLNITTGPIFEGLICCDPVFNSDAFGLSHPACRPRQVNRQYILSNSGIDVAQQVVPRRFSKSPRLFPMSRSWRSSLIRGGSFPAYAKISSMLQDIVRFGSGNHRFHKSNIFAITVNL